MSEFLKGVRAAKSSLCVPPLDGWLEQWRSLVLYCLVMLFKEEMQLLVKQRTDIGRLWTPGWPCISHDSWSLFLFPDPVGGWCPSDVRVWMSSTAMKHPLESALWIVEQNRKSVLHSHVFPSILLAWVWCFQFLRWGAGDMSLLSVWKIEGIED